MEDWEIYLVRFSSSPDWNIWEVPFHVRFDEKSNEITDYNGVDELDHKSGDELKHNSDEKDSASSTWAEEGVSTSNREGNNGDADDESLQLVQRFTTLTFGDANEAGAHYQCFAQLCGFDILKNSVKRGHRKERIDERDRLRGHKPETRCGCPALFRVALNRSIGIYRVTDFEPKHNHSMETPNTSHILRCNRILTPATKIMFNTMTHVGCKPSQVLDLLDHLGGGSATGVLNTKDAYNYLNSERLKRIESGDVNTLLGVLDGMKLKAKTLEYKHGIDQGGALTRIFWHDGISKAEYEELGDVLVFDSTYKTNIYCFPVVLFCGVSSHLCTCIFGVAIMYKETTQQYMWLLQTLLEFMGGKPPKVVLTDQDGAMRAAIRIVFPKAAHRLSCWHISCNVESNIKKPGFSTEFSNLMNMPCSVPKFEDRWSPLIAKFGLTDDPYLADLYEKRSQWAESFFQDQFFAMMMSTQRADSMNASLKQKWLVDVGKRLTSAFSYQQTDNLYTSGSVKMREDGIEFNITPTDGDDESCSPLHSDSEDTIHSVKRPRNVVDPCKIVSKEGSIRKKQLCSFCRKPGHKTTTCELNPKAGFPSRDKVNSKQSASGSDNVGSRSYVP
ncbi:PREDICTED: protein FAR1-RELATED SEQUENCE 5-like [Erythranthe guttata]|uniref:protein FAR1-RELATED SEQUENCE 5-like n=1 Tax=Erythranthe guttata TaxID=4155 RepID=UPI00064DD74E|nr:PREDICTED: protein FAR1-RELATED SEQUENCE 5-like [Erythranthe guttata]|eukprot:XP_012855089.1 PREDICTED: protein FAR1-RELATED SEQUENCE 5-like [Erythranthe guttata]